jgi:Ca2+-binding EF-hand superfamily protein
VSDEELNVLFQLFCRYDVDGTGYMSKIDLLENLFEIRRSMLTDALCELCDVRDSQEYVTYPDFVVIVCTYALFEPRDMLLFCFAIFDREKQGFIDKDEFKHFLSSLVDYNLNTNLKHALAYMETLDTGDGQFTFQEIFAAYCAYPSLFYPIFQLQVHMQRNTLGVRYWEEKKVELTDAVQLRRKIEKAKRQKKIKEGEMALDEEQNNQELIAKMGILFYLTPWRRAAERELLKKIKAVDAALEEEQKAAEGKK